MSTSRRPREQLENIWRENVRVAYEAYMRARNRAGEAARHADILSLDGSHAYQQALRRERSALREYRIALRTFTDLVIRGKLPPGR